MKDFKLFKGFCFMTVAFATEKFPTQKSLNYVELFCFFSAIFVHLTSSGFAYFLVVWWREQGQAGCGDIMFR